MANLGQLVVNLEANIARFTSDMGRASQATEQAMSRMSAAADRVKNILGAVGVALSVDAIVGEVNKTIDALAALDDMAQKTGSSVETLSKLSKVATFTGTDLGAVDGMLVKLSKNLATVDEEGNKTAKALAAIGLSTDDLKNQDPAQIFVQVATKLQDYEDGAGKVAVVTDLMGKSAADLLPYMNDVAESINDFAGESAQAAANAARFQDDLGRLRVKYDELKTEIVTAAIPAATSFIEALMDTKREANSLTNDTSVDTWADDVAIGLAQMADYATVTVRTLSALSGSVKVVTADILTLASASPVNMAVQVAQGKNPLDDYRAMMAEREKILTEANRKWDTLLNSPVNAIEERVRKRIDERHDAELYAGIDAMAGLDPNAKKSKRDDINYGSGPTKSSQGSGTRGISQAELSVSERAAARMVELANDETFALRGTIDATLDLQEADERRWAQQLRAADRNAANVEQMRQSLMTDAEHEQFTFESRMEQLRIFSASRLENEMQANALMEAETARHEAAVVELERQSAEQRMQLDMMVLNQASGVAGQMYSMLKQAGLEQTAVAKAAFLASKGLAVAQIILSTNVAAASALAPPPIGLGPVAGLGLAGTIKALGYSSAAMTAGLAIAEASAEGGYDIPAGVNPVTQLHEKEMVLPKKQAEVIRNLADSGGGAGGKGANITYAPNFNIDARSDQAQVRKDMQMVAQQANADLVDRLQRAGRI